MNKNIRPHQLKLLPSKKVLFFKELQLNKHVYRGLVFENMNIPAR